jgi:hypothetical protein
MNIPRPNAIADAKARRFTRGTFGRPAATEHRFNIVVPQNAISSPRGWPAATSSADTKPR